jgi:EAL domain-containing protein (putative c-di-GMP-specific phosphodiesterase class I)
VETQADFEVVRASGCDAAQGWHIGHPVDARAFLDAALSRR